MRLVKPGYEVMTALGRSMLSLIEAAGRTCYKSEDQITTDSAHEFCRRIIDRGHLSVIEHASVTVRFTVDRGVSHELVRHRLAAYSQESTRYCDYKGGIMFVIPPWCGQLSEGEWERMDILRLWKTYLNGTVADQWLLAMARAASSYTELRAEGWTPQQARSVLPNSLKTEIVMTANLREWRHVFELRCSKGAHPQMQEVMIPLREEFRQSIPVIFEAAAEPERGRDE